MSVLRLDRTWIFASSSTAVSSLAVNRPVEPPHTSVLACGRTTPLAQAGKLPLPLAALTSSTVISAAVAPAGTFEELALRSITRAVLATSGVFGPPEVGGVPGRESYTRTG